MRVLELWNGSVFELDLTDPFKDERKILGMSFVSLILSVWKRVLVLTFAVAVCVLMIAIIHQ